MYTDYIFLSKNPGLSMWYYSSKHELFVVNACAIDMSTLQTDAEFLGNQNFLRPSNNSIVKIRSNNKIVQKIYLKEEHAHIPL